MVEVGLGDCLGASEFEYGLQEGVTSVGFDEAVSAMEIEFAGGAVYRYFAVPAAVHAALMDASSKGVFFNRHVRAKYPFARV